jgi:hypothetical protein
MEFLTITAATAPETLAVSALPLNTQTRPGDSSSSRPCFRGKVSSTIRYTYPCVADVWATFAWRPKREARPPLKRV